MILAFCLLTLLVATNTGAQRIKGGPRFISEPAIQEPHIHVGKGGVGGALHHTAVVADPISHSPVVVEKVTSLGSSGGIKSAGLGPSSSQFTLADAQIPSFGQRALYRGGASQVPFGLSGLDYYSYPASLLTSRRGLRRKTIVSDNVSGLRPIGFGRKSAIIADPTTSQFSVGDAQIRTSAFGGRGLYRTGLSPVPFGLSGLDYYSYPKQLLTQRGILDDGLGQTRILSGGGFTAGDAQISGLVADPLGQEKVIIESDPTFGGPAIVQAAQDIVPEQVTTIVEDGGFGQRQLTTLTKSAGGFGGLRGGQILLRGGPRLGGLRRVKSRPIVQAASPIDDIPVLVDATSGLGAPFGGFGQRQVAVTKSVAPSPVFAAPAPIVQAPVFAAPAPIVHAPVFAAPAPIVKAPVFSAPAPIVKAPVFSAPAPIIQTPVVAPIRRRLGEAFLTQAVRPVVAARRVATIARPVAQVVSQPRVAVVQQAPRFGIPGNIQFTLGNTQIIGGPAVAPAAVVAPAPIVAARRPVFAVQRPVVAAVQRPVVAVQRPVVAVQQPVVSGVKTSGFGGRRIFGRRFPQMFYVDGGSRYPGIDIIGGYRIGDPRFNYAQLPISTQRFANLGLTQARIPGFSTLDSQGSIDAGPVLVAPAPVPAFATKSVPVISTPIAKTTIAQANPLGLTAIGHTSQPKVVTQEEVIGPAGDRQVVTTVTNAGPSKIGGPVIAGPLGLTAIGQTGGTKTVTQEEVIGPAGDSQIITTVTKSAPSKIGGPVVAAPLGLTGIGHTSPAKVVTQEEVIGPAGDSQIITTVTKSAPSKIGGPVVAAPLGLTGIGHTSPAKVITQEEVIGPAGDTQVITTVTDTAAPSKIGGSVLSNPLGFTAVGQAPSKVITQEEVVGPAGDTQVITTVSEASPIVQQEEVLGLSPVSSLTASPLSQIAQDPIETALTQATLGDSAIISSGPSALNPFSQSIVDPVGAGQTQLSIDDVIGPSTGALFSQQPIAAGGLSDPIVQQSISSGFDGGLGYVPRVSFLSQYPYDVPSRAILRQAVTRPIVQEQQQLEQFLV